MVHVVTKSNTTKSKRVWKHLNGNIPLVIVIVMVLIISIIYMSVLYKAHSELLNQIGFIGILIGLFLGVTITTLSFIYYEKKIMYDKYEKTVISYSKIIKADMERTKRLFKDKRFTLLKINEISIIDDWTSILSNISFKLKYKEVEEYINYYSQINKLKQYRIDINNHLNKMEETALKEYPCMKEYNSLINNFSKEVNKLFNIDINFLNIKINSLLKNEK